MKLLCVLVFFVGCGLFPAPEIVKTEACSKETVMAQKAGLALECLEKVTSSCGDRWDLPAVRTLRCKPFESREECDDRAEFQTVPSSAKSPCVQAVRMCAELVRAVGVETETIINGNQVHHHRDP